MVKGATEKCDQAERLAASGDTAGAAECYQDAAAILVQSGDRLQAYTVFRWLADLHLRVGDKLLAAEAYQRGFELTEAAMGAEQLLGGLNNLVDMFSKYHRIQFEMSHQTHQGSTKQQNCL
jgi:hypothetical protein